MLGTMNLASQPLYTQFRHNANAAVAFLRERGSGVAVAALFHAEVGDIDLVWGETSEDERNKGFGLAKLIRWHPEALHDLQGFISKLHVHQVHRKKGEIHLTDGKDLRAGIKLTWNGKTQHWLITAYDKKNASGSRSTPAVLDKASGLTTASPDTAGNFILGFERPSVNEDDVMQTPIIRYNLKDRGRKHTGQERNFNIKAISDAINGKSCQEMIETRGMIGFYGHLPRVRYGMAPVEAGIEGGKYAPVEPAFVTTYLKADYNGNVEHRAEFLDTASGKLALKLWDSKVGGFSSAIDQNKPEFFGFDYVISPNFVSNSFRGVSLDSALCEGGTCGLSCCDVDAAILEEQQAGMMALLDSVNMNYDAVQDVMDSLKRENASLRKSLSRHQAAEANRKRIKPSVMRAERMVLDAAEFKSANLVLPQGMKEQIKQSAQEQFDYGRMVSALTGGKYRV